LTGTWRNFPVPTFNVIDVRRVESAVHDYFAFLHRDEAAFQLRGDDVRTEEAVILRDLHWRIDAEVLRLYDLPSEIERQLLDYFTGWKRVGVPFEQDGYFPKGFDEAISLVDFLAITTNWESTNRRRYELIDAKAIKPLSPREVDELKKLQQLAGFKRELLSSPSLTDLAELETDLRRRKLWRGA
jgi:hypothetical protein